MTACTAAQAAKVEVPWRQRLRGPTLLESSRRPAHPGKAREVGCLAKLASRLCGPLRPPKDVGLHPGRFHRRGFHRELVSGGLQVLRYFKGLGDWAGIHASSFFGYSGHASRIHLFDFPQFRSYFASETPYGFVPIGALVEVD